MADILMITQVVISVLLIVVVLIQNKNISLNLTSMGAGMGEVKKRGLEKVIHNTTIILGTLFSINSLVLFLVK